MSQAQVKAALLNTIQTLTEHPNRCNVVFRAETTWEEDVRCDVKIRDFASFKVDEPPELGGQDSAANPVELVLAALGTCQEIMYSAYAAVMDIELESVKVNARGFLDLKGLFGMDAEVPPGYKRITFETTLNSPADEDKLRTLIDTVEKHCPVLDILTRSIPVNGSVKLNGRTLDAAQDNAA